MLKDLPEMALVPSNDPLMRLMASLDTGSAHGTRRLAQGVYEAHLNWNHEIAPYIADIYGFERPVWDGDWETRPQNYGVCDNWEQILDRWPQIESDPRPLVIKVTPIRKEDQEPSGGWRWHKWGEYIGVHEPEHEYLYDEEDIDVVYVFSIYELKE